jgi:hypothetical protein
LLGLFFSPQAAEPFTVVALARHGLALVNHPEIQPGCVLVAVQGDELKGLSYAEGLAKITGAERPLRLEFEQESWRGVCGHCLSPVRFCVCSFVVTVQVSIHAHDRLSSGSSTEEAETEETSGSLPHYWWPAEAQTQTQTHHAHPSLLDAHGDLRDAAQAG